MELPGRGWADLEPGAGLHHTRCSSGLDLSDVIHHKLILRASLLAIANHVRRRPPQQPHQRWIGKLSASPLVLIPAVGDTSS